MNKKFLLLVACLALLFICSSLQTGCKREVEKKSLTKEELIVRGKYLVDYGGCNDCHSPKVMAKQGPIPDGSRLLSGHRSDLPLPEFDPKMVEPGKWIFFNSDATAAVGPWGISFAANLTPDKETGLGLWTDEIFIKTMRTGRHMGTGRQILPPMPWYSFGQLTDEDLKAIFAYLQSLPPIKNPVPAPIPPWQ